MNTAGGQSALLPRLWLYLVSPWAKTVEQGASTSVCAALDLTLEGGEYLDDCAVSHDTHSEVDTEARAADLWDYTENLLNLKISHS